MHHVTMGLTNQPYRWGNSRPIDNANLSRIERHASDKVATPVSSGNLLGSMLTNLSSSISSMSSQLDSMAARNSLPSTTPGSVSVGMGAQVINKQRGEMQVRTQEGDVVTLKFSSKIGMKIEGQSSGDSGKEVSDASIELRSRSRISMSVEGNLNADELAAITDLVGEVGELTSEFFNGDVDKALAKAANLSYDSSQLADYSLDLRLKQSIKAYAFVEFSAPPPPRIESVPVANDTAIVDTIVAAEVPAESEVADSTIAETDVSTVAAAPTTAAEASDGEVSSNTGATLTEFVSRVRAMFTAKVGDASLGFSYEFKARLLISSIAESSPAATNLSESVLNDLDKQLGATAA
ncbi:MAG: hypothetical protein AB7F79_11865 [Steroidobacteraceae bacterium]